MMHIFASEPDHFPPIKALFELVTSVTLTIFQQGTLSGVLKSQSVFTSLSPNLHKLHIFLTGVLYYFRWQHYEKCPRSIFVNRSLF